MNKKATIFLTGLVVVTIGIGTGAYFLNHSSVTKQSSEATSTATTPTIAESLRKEVETNTKFTQTDTVKTFKTTKEAETYAKQMSTIDGITEAGNFINNFYKGAQTNRASEIIGFYYPDYRPVIENAANLPFLDITDQTYCKITNIKTVDKGKNVYTVTYKLDMYDKNDDEDTPFYTINREDTLTLMKEFNKIYIIKLGLCTK